MSVDEKKKNARKRYKQLQQVKNQERKTYYLDFKDVKTGDDLQKVIGGEKTRKLYPKQWAINKMGQASAKMLNDMKRDGHQSRYRNTVTSILTERFEGKGSQSGARLVPR